MISLKLIVKYWECVGIVCLNIFTINAYRRSYQKFPFKVSTTIKMKIYRDEVYAESCLVV